jgi:hypothetical protein
MYCFLCRGVGTVAQYVALYNLHMRLIFSHCFSRGNRNGYNLARKKEKNKHATSPENAKVRERERETQRAYKSG